MSHLSIIQRTLTHEAAALEALSRSLGEPVHEQSLNNVVELLLECEGQIVVSGMGKMGQVARKAAATFCSTGTPALFLHPGEAVHGDLGVVTGRDVWLALSNSGETDEITALLPFMHRFEIPVVTITGKPESSLAARSRHVLSIGVAEEVEPVTQAPTTSTTLALALCDALAVALMHHRGFTAEQFAIFHPGGHLGRKLLLTVEQLMHTGNRIPVSRPDISVVEGIMVMSQKGLGSTMVVDDGLKLLGIFTDGDLRRTLEKQVDLSQLSLMDAMTPNPLSTHPQALAAEALKLMEDREITVLPVVDSEKKLVGVLHLHDLIRVGLA